MKKRAILFLFFTAVILSACGNNEPATRDVTPLTEQPPTTVPTPTLMPTPAGSASGTAIVDSIQINILESFPVQVNVIARGELPDGCTQINDITTERQNDTFNITITTLRPADADCTQAIVPFAETISLDVVDLPAGTYTVDVNSIRGSFTLDMDNSLQAEEPAATTAPESGNQGVINGRVWHDECAVAEDGDTAVPSAGCVPLDDGFIANGVLDGNEFGIEGVTVNLGEGACPAAGWATAVTDTQGDYVFTELPAGDYCISIDALAPENAELLPGQWSFPQPGDAAEIGVTLDAGQVSTGNNFGWDYQFLPVPEVDLANCTNSLEFVEDLSVPDDTIFAPGSEFTKSWRLRNDGTCPWTTDYSLVAVGGDDIPGPTAVPLPGPVAPGQTVDLSVTFTAPEEEGVYRENWLLSDPNNQTFGVGGLASEVFWVKFTVGVPEPTPEPNSAVIGGVVWEDFCRVIDGEPTQGCVEIEDTGFYRADGSLNFNERRLPGVTVILAKDACPEDGIFSNADILSTTITDEDGLYRFPNLEEGLYCVAIDALSPANVDLLIPGSWTWPFVGTGRIGIILAPGEERLEVDFGWDHQD